VAAIDITIEDSLLIVTVTGDLTVNDMISVVLKHYHSTEAKDIIWDLSDGSLRTISQDGFVTIANTVKIAVASGSRQGGKTAFVGTVEREHALSRLYTVIADVTGVPIKYNVFRTIEEARGWIDQN
jgi:hypothetical protein